MGLISSVSGLSMRDFSLVVSPTTKFAKGTASVGANQIATVAGLTFTPKLVILNYYDGSYAWRKSYNGYGTNATWSDSLVYGKTSGGGSSTTLDGGAWTITADGFSTLFTAGAIATIEWVAIG